MRVYRNSLRRVESRVWKLVSNCLASGGSRLQCSGFRAGLHDSFRVEGSKQGLPKSKMDVGLGMHSLC